MTTYDVIGDIHGHADELKELLGKLGYKKNAQGVYEPPEGQDRKAVFIGDFIDRGPNNFAVIDIVSKMVEAGRAHAIMGNHDLNFILYTTEKESYSSKPRWTQNNPG